MALEDVQYLAGHSSPTTTPVYDRRRRKVTRNQVKLFVLLSEDHRPVEHGMFTNMKVFSTLTALAAAAILIGCGSRPEGQSSCIIAPPSTSNYEHEIATDFSTEVTKLLKLPLSADVESTIKEKASQASRAIPDSTVICHMTYETIACISKQQTDLSNEIALDLTKFATSPDGPCSQGKTPTKAEAPKTDVAAPTPVVLPVTIHENVNRHDTRVIPTGEGVEDGGVFKITLQAPGKILHAKYDCEGGVCGWVHPCPNGGKCRNHPYDFDYDGNTATFYAWSNSADNGIFKFEIVYQPN